MKEMYQMFIKMEKEGKGVTGGDDDDNDTDDNMAVKEDNFRGAELRDLGTAELPYGVSRSH